ncbi:uncharacterized protein LOC129965545 isoform X1 [Argiope bruennichi]|uniref:uncharacterized protein LOC129965545 isoform X1 n=1 Tax=Argiope bruennichi TaxID=94029 RepID=UPI0024943203|nr:uncharacterized protein LOC129965545 isoform X1 [Argiope bruennichi]
MVKIFSSDGQYGIVIGCDTKLRKMECYENSISCRDDLVLRSRLRNRTSKVKCSLAGEPQEYETDASSARGRRRAGTTYGRGKDTQEEIPSESQGSFGIPGSDGDVTTKRVLKTPSRPELRC